MALSEEQLRRIERNRDIALAIRAAFERPAREPSAAAHSFNFDEAEGGEFEEQPNWNQSFDNSETPSCNGKRRKLLVKTSPIGTWYPLTALGSRAAYKVAMEQKVNILRETRTDKRVVANAAISLLARHHMDGQLGVLSSMNSKSTIPVAKPHPSHEIATLPNHDGIIWCRRCTS